VNIYHSYITGFLGVTEWSAELYPYC